MTHMTDAETDQLIGNLQTAEIKRQQRSLIKLKFRPSAILRRPGPKKDKKRTLVMFVK